MVDKVYYVNEGLSLAWDLGIIFYAYQICDLKGFAENLCLKGVIEKCAIRFLVYLFFRDLFY